jgi:hypothetical protein
MKKAKSKIAIYKPPKDEIKIDFVPDDASRPIEDMIINSIAEVIAGFAVLHVYNTINKNDPYETT